MRTIVVMDNEGHIVIPAEARTRLGLSPGDQLAVRLDGNRVVLQRPADAMAELRRLTSDVPAGTSLVDELLTERRLAAEAGE